MIPIDVSRVLRAPKSGLAPGGAGLCDLCLQRGRASLALASSAVTTYWKPSAKPLILNCLLEIPPVSFPAHRLLALETFPHGIAPR